MDVQKINLDWSDSDNDVDEKEGKTYTSFSVKEESQQRLEMIFREKEVYDKMDEKKRDLEEAQQKAVKGGIT